MADLRFDFEWLSYADADRRVGETTAQLKVHIGDLCLTHNEDAWSRTVRDRVTVSLYPLAMWFASSWWRLNHEVLPADARNRVPVHDWRMSHELAAANMGFVWPGIVFASDRDAMNIWTQASRCHERASVKYLNGSGSVRSVPMTQFADAATSFVNAVVARLDAVGLQNSDLAQLWSIVLEDMANPEECRRRRIEAELGFDPKECPDAVIGQAMAFAQTIGESSFAELSGAYAKNGGERVEAMRELADASGIVGRPDLPDMDLERSEGEPWQHAVSAAHELRGRIGRPGGVLPDDALHDLLGLQKGEVENWMPQGQAKASVAGKRGAGDLAFILRKRHPVSRRFELARFIGDHIRSVEREPGSWLVTADLATARQKFQRAFAAEFLCPIASLVEFLDGEVSESAIEDAASEFAVSERTVESLLENNGYLAREGPGTGMPYNLFG
ncbi:MAG: hypothetical protein OXC91_12365 [Rhodobacteraceae bacterium]|nr:hypothetical protein [Paracoccaceae bacterium]